MRRTVLTLLLALFLLPIAAQEQTERINRTDTVTDTTYVFRFTAGKDMFYVPYSDNDKELARLESCVEKHKDNILARKTPLHVDGYCNSAATEKENFAIAKIRSNRVKSELIIRSGLTESCFVTRNHAYGGDYVSVRLVVSATDSKAEADAAAIERERTEHARLEAERKAEQERIAREQAEKERSAREQAEREAAEQAEHERQIAAEQARLQAEAAAKAKPYTLSLRANLLRWATLTPDLGIEWRINPSWGIQVNGSWTSWTWSGNDRRYALWEVAPEVRWYLGKEKCGYIGAMYKAGQFNYKLSETGKQGDLMGGGITAGYQLRLNKALDLDFNLGLGYLNADFEKYEVIDGVRVRRGNETKNWCSPINAGVTLVWKLF